MRALFTATALVVFVVLAGCTGSSGSSTPDAKDPNGPRLGDALSDDAGAVHGIVTDTEQVPLAGAIVAIKDLTQTATLEDGRYEIGNIPPGSYMVYAQALGYNSVGRNITVVAGEATEAAFQLDPLPIQGPRHETILKEGHICGQVYANGYFVNTGNLPCNGQGSIFVPFNVLGSLTGLVVEIQWTKTSGVTSNVLAISVWQGGSRSGVFSCEHCYGPSSGPSPVKLVVQGPFKGLEGVGPAETKSLDNTISVPADPSRPAGVNAVVDQRIKLFDTLFYGGPADPNFTAIPDQ